MANTVIRREFMVAALAGGVLAGALPASSYRRVAGSGGKLNIGAIGVGGRGAGDLDAVSSENIVALCDVDARALGAASARHSGARKYQDYRQLLEQKDLEAVIIGTPDHHHAPPTVRALKRGLHVYCEKPSRTPLPKHASSPAWLPRKSRHPNGHPEPRAPGVYSPC